MGDRGNVSAVELGPAEVVEGRGFTDLVRNERDRKALQVQLEDLLRVVSREPAEARRADHRGEAEDGNPWRHVLNDIPGLRETRPIVVVGFCGQLRESADRVRLAALDEELVEEMPEHPYLLSYSTRRQPDGDCVNLVLFRAEDGIENWSGSQRHAEIVEEISSAAYRSIRLHNGRISEGITEGARVVLEVSKYFDYGEEDRDQVQWIGIRKLGTGDRN